MQMVLARELARSLGGLAWIWGITSFAGSKSIGIYGSEEQKKKYLPLIAKGQLKAAIALIGRAHVCTPVTNAPLVCRLLLETKNNKKHTTTCQNTLRTHN